MVSLFNLLLIDEPSLSPLVDQLRALSNEIDATSMLGEINSLKRHWIETRGRLTTATATGMETDTPEPHNFSSRIHMNDEGPAQSTSFVQPRPNFGTKKAKTNLMRMSKEEEEEDQGAKKKGGNDQNHTKGNFSARMSRNKGNPAVASIERLERQHQEAMLE